MTNIVVVQHSEVVQTSRDVIYNLTCVVRPPGEAVVTSGYIGAGSVSHTINDQREREREREKERKSGERERGWDQTLCTDGDMIYAIK